MFSRILIANRGEIALRVIRACRELGIETVAVYSEADADAIYLRIADEAICIGPGNAMKSYLDISRIISAAEIADVEAIHPGYGFLAENSHFAEVCESCNITFIGPAPESMNRVADKVEAKRLAKECNVPMLGGSDGAVGDEQDALKIAHEIGYPVIIKAAGGGGGRGMRIAHNDYSLTNGVMQAQAEAGAAFKNSDVYIEKYIEKARHVEVQILGDKHGNIVYLGERDCTLQRRYQKLVEESPCPVFNEDQRKAIGEAAVRYAQGANYHNAGTVEFLVDGDGNFYFIEMNARIQVEHPVTEMVTGIDLIKEQIRVAAGEPLGYGQDDITITGHAIECRINAEDPEDDFRPHPGKVNTYFPPGGIGVRVDSHLYGGYTIPPTYDSMVAKLIVHKENRDEAIRTMRRALSEFVIDGVPTTIPFHQDIFSHTHFIRSQIDTGFVERFLAT
jgi:acetyl-CoA carboxylase biotin carboxylase subunit